MAFSLILDKTSNIEVKRNTVIAPSVPTASARASGFEMGGDNALFEDNYIDGVSVTAYDTDGHGSGSVTLRNNKFKNYKHGDYQAFPAANRTYHSENNGPDVQLSWDINRPKPGIDGNATEEIAPVKKPGKKADTDYQERLQVQGQGQGQVRRRGLHVRQRHEHRRRRQRLGPDRAEPDQRQPRRQRRQAITLNGKEYDKGIGVAINSSVTYNLDGKYARFFSDIGVDDSTGGEGSVTFQVWADGKKIFDSGVIHGNDAKKASTPTSPA